VLIRTREDTRLALGRTTPIGLARVLTCDKSTTSRGKACLRDLNGEQLVRLLAYDSELREAFVAALSERPEPLLDAPEIEVHRLLRPAAALTDHILQRLEDHHLSGPELRATAVEYEQLAEIAKKGAASCRNRMKSLRRSR
jgi:hypothetical protein